MTTNWAAAKPSRMWPYHPDLLSTPVPRYTSYPTAAEFGTLWPFTVRGLASINGDYLTITPDGLPYARTIAALFDPDRQQSKWRFSAAV